jgi:hypothetical protein
MNHKEVFHLVLRYLVLLALAFPNLFLIYAVFTPLTLKSTFFLLDKFYSPVILQGNSLILSNVIITLIPACIGGAAYYFLLMFNLSAPMSLVVRAKSILFLLGSFFILNLARILIFSVLATSSFNYFDITHAIFWYFGSTIFVVLIWFASVRIFRIKAIPFYTDLKSLYAKAAPKSRKNNKN